MISDGSMNDVMTLILGLGDPCAPGMHGELQKPCPDSDAVAFVTKIRDMCENWLRSAGKGADSSTTSSQQVGNKDSFDNQAEDDE